MSGKRKAITGYAAMLLLSSSLLSARSKAPEVFVHMGTFSAGSDEGTIGRAPSFGGGIAIPLNHRVVAELDIQTSQIRKIRSPDNFRIRRYTLILPNLYCRWGGVRAYGFVGAGFGTEVFDRISRTDNIVPVHTRLGWREIKARVFEHKYSTQRTILFAPRAGFVAFPIQRLGVRVDFYLANWHMGARIGAVYRFK